MPTPIDVGKEMVPKALPSNRAVLAKRFPVCRLPGGTLEWGGGWLWFFNRASHCTKIREGKRWDVQGGVILHCQGQPALLTDGTNNVSTIPPRQKKGSRSATSLRKGIALLVARDREG